MQLYKRGSARHRRERPVRDHRDSRGVYNVEFSVLGRKRETRFEVAVTPGARSRSTCRSRRSGRGRLGDRDRLAVPPAGRVAGVRAEHRRGRDRALSRRQPRHLARDPEPAWRRERGDVPANDVLVRGGAPNENRFYLDGVEVPVINHFATQGSSGGPVGMIDVNFVGRGPLHRRSRGARQRASAR